MTSPDFSLCYDCEMPLTMNNYEYEHLESQIGKLSTNIEMV